MFSLPLHQANATRIGGSIFSFATQDGQTTYFANLEPCDCHAEGDRQAMLLRVAKFAAGGVRHKHLQDAFGISRTTVHRAAKKLAEEGEKSFFAPRRGRGVSVLVGEKAAAAERLLASGMTGAGAARELGVSVSTMNHNRRKGLIGPAKAEPAEPAPLDRSARDRRDRDAPMGRAARDAAGRVAASAGAMPEAAPQFREPLSAVANGGVLAALPMLLREGLLKRGLAHLSLPKGYYGLASILLLLSFLFLARMRNAEALRHQAPGEWGAVLGLDRCPEVKTLRRKVRALAADAEALRSWQQALAADWLASASPAAPVLSVDGHVKVYAGRKGRLPKHFVSRQKLCLPAMSSYWINLLGGQPLLCLHKALDPTMTGALEQDILPALEALGLPGPAAPDLTAEPEAEPALTLVFDREGWSPTLFRRLARRGIAVITWRKGRKGEGWPEAEFRTVEAAILGPGGSRTVKVRLAERQIALANGPKVREIRRLLDNGRQMPLATTNFRLPLQVAAGALFSRWAQENYFKYMREEFNLDALPVHRLAEPDPQAQIVNPDWRRLDRSSRQLQSKLGARRNRIAQLLRGKPSAAASAAADRLKAECDGLDAEREGLKRRLKDTPKHVRVADLDDAQKLDALPAGEKLLLDIIRMIAYRAETRMMAAVAGVQGAKERPRRTLGALFQAAADITPDPAAKTLRVRILGTASNAGDAELAKLLEELNQTRTAFPGTDLRLVYELPGNAAKSAADVA